MFTLHARALVALAIFMVILFVMLTLLPGQQAAIRARSASGQGATTLRVAAPDSPLDASAGEVGR